MATPRTTRKKGSEAVSPAPEPATPDSVLSDPRVPDDAIEPKDPSESAVLPASLTGDSPTNTVVLTEPEGRRPDNSGEAEALGDAETNVDNVTGAGVSADPVADVPPAPVQPDPDREPDPASVPDSVPASVVVQRKGGFVPLVLGGVLAAAGGFAVARYAVPEGWPFPGTAALQAQMQDQAANLANLQAEVQAQSSVDLGPEVAALRETAAQALQTAEAARLVAETAPAGFQDLAPRLAALEDRLTALEQRPVNDDTAVDPAALAGVQAEVEALGRDLESRLIKAETTAAAVQADLAALQANVDSQKSEAEAAQAAVAEQAAAVLIRAAALQLDAAVQNGAPFAEPVQTLLDAGADVSPVLRDSAAAGVPTLVALIDSFTDPARQALESALRSDVGDSMTQRLGSFLRSQTGARSLTPQEGGDTDAVLSRAEAALRAGDLAAAVTELGTLPEAAKPALATWMASAETRLAAQNASAGLLASIGER